MKKVEVEVTAIIEIPDDLEERLRGGPSGEDDNANAYEEVATGIKDRQFTILRLELSDIEPVTGKWQLQ